MENILCEVCGSKNHSVAWRNQFHTINCGNQVFVKDIVNVVCQECGQIYNNPAMTSDELTEIYKAMTRNVVDGVKTDYATLPIEEAQYRFIKENIQLPDNPKVLDIGCSLGGFLQLFIKEGAQCMGCEPSIPDAKVAMSRGISVINRMFQPEDYPSQHFDLIALRFVFEHLQHPSAMLKDLLKLLKPGGFIFIEVPDMAHPFIGLDDFFSFGHTFTFSKETLEQISLVNGYKIGALAEVDNSAIARRSFPSLRILITPDEEKRTAGNLLDLSLRLIQDYRERRLKLMAQMEEQLKAAEVDSSASIILYGAGTHTAELLTNFPWLKEKCVGFVDGNRDLQNYTYLGKMVYSPMNLPSLNFEKIIISAREAEEEIYQYLSSLGLGDKAVLLYGKK